MTTFLTVVHVLTCLVLILVVLLQTGKGAEIGAVFGAGSSSTVFGARGAGNFLTKLTTGAAIVFMISSLTLSYLATQGITSTILEEPDLGPAAIEESATPAGEEGAGGFVEVAPAVELPEAEPRAQGVAPGGEAAEPEAAPAPEAPEMPAP